MKEILLVLLEALVQQMASVVSILVKKAEIFASMLVTVSYLLMKKKYLSLKLTIKVLTFQYNFVLEVFLMEVLSLEKDFSMAVCMILQSLTILLKNLTY